MVSVFDSQIVPGLNRKKVSEAIRVFSCQTASSFFVFFHYNRHMSTNQKSNSKQPARKSGKRKKRSKLRVDRLLILGGAVLVIVLLAGFGLSRLFGGHTNLKDEKVTSETERQADQKQANDEEQVRKKKEEEAKQAAVDEIMAKEVGETVDVSSLDQDQIQQLFYDEAVDQETLDAMEGVTWTSQQDFLKPEDLRYMKVLYTDFEGNTKIGEMILNQEIVKDAEDIFLELYQNKYPIEQMVLPDNYGGDDNTNMINDNTSGFSFRFSDGIGLAIHEHSLGLAIDINPYYNPQVVENEGSVLVFPWTSEAYADRSNKQEHMIDESDLAYQIFTKHGFNWGGVWEGRPDYMHFEKNYNQSQFQVIDPNFTAAQPGQDS